MDNESTIDYVAEWEFLRDQYLWMAKTFPAYAQEFSAKAAVASGGSLIAAV
jgi:hypothetical protein